MIAVLDGFRFATGVGLAVLFWGWIALMFLGVGLSDLPVKKKGEEKSSQPEQPK